MDKIPFTLRHFANEVQADLNEAFERQLLVKERLADEIERLKRITTRNNELLRENERRIESADYELNRISNLKRCAEEIERRSAAGDLESIELIQPQDVLDTESDKEPDELDEFLDYEDYWENNKHWGEPTEEG